MYRNFSATSSTPRTARASVLVAEDDAVSRRVIEATLTDWGYRVVACANGRDALAELEIPEPPQLVILDWMMPELDGIEVCRRIRLREPGRTPAYVLMLTANGARDEVVVGLESGADDYVVKPFDPAELRARLRVGERIVRLQQALAGRVVELESALSRVRQLQGLLPICCYCKRIRDGRDYWEQVETYIGKHSDARFTHGICPDCYERVASTELADSSG